MNDGKIALNHADYESKLDQLEAVLKMKNHKIQKLENQVKQQNEKLDCFNKTFSKFKFFNNFINNFMTYFIKYRANQDLDKILSLCENFFRLFGTTDVLARLKVLNETGDEDLTILSASYPDVTVSQDFKTEINSMITNEQNSASSIYRKMIGTLIDDNSIWVKRNQKSMRKDYSKPIYACYGTFFIIYFS